MKKDILCYLLLIISISLFVYTYVFLEPIELNEVHDEIGEGEEEILISPIYENGLENRDVIEKIYVGEINLISKWGDFLPLFTAYKEEFVQKYELYEEKEETEEKIQYENETYLRYGIKMKEERESLYKVFKEATNIDKIEVVSKSISKIDDGITFEIKATEENNKEYILNCKIFNTITPDNIYLKILPKENG